MNFSNAGVNQAKNYPHFQNIISQLKIYGVKIRKTNNPIPKAYIILVLVFISSPLRLNSLKDNL
jgi:hypothetical protein